MKYMGFYDNHKYIGAKTCTVYYFGLFRQIGYVDSRDKDGFLSLREDGLVVFEKV
jgi:hypothetical protein